jgi:hypothetical protein
MSSDEPREESPAAIERLDGRAMAAYLELHPTVLYRYQPNKPGFAFLLTLALIAGAGGALVWTQFGLPTLWHGLAVVLLVAIAAVLAGLVAYWTRFTRLHYVAASDSHLLIGKGAQVLAIRWNALDLDRLGLAADDDQLLRGVLALQLDDRQVRLRLFNGFAVLRNLQGFMSTLLTRVQANQAA